MYALDCLKTRRCVRKYSDKKVIPELIDEILDCARLAPSGHNKQPWHFIVVKDKANLKKIAELAQYGKHIESCAFCIIVCCEDEKYYLEDGCAATQNILLAAKAVGLGGCWVAGDKKDYCEPVKEMLDIPKEIKIVSFLPIGYPDEDPEPPRKKELSEVVHMEKF